MQCSKWHSLQSCCIEKRNDPFYSLASCTHVLFPIWCSLSVHFSYHRRLRLEAFFTWQHTNEMACIRKRTFHAYLTLWLLPHIGIYLTQEFYHLTSEELNAQQEIESENQMPYFLFLIQFHIRSFECLSPRWLRCALFAWYRMSFQIVRPVRFAGVCAERKVKCKQMQENLIKIRAGTFTFCFSFYSSLHSMHSDVYSIGKKRT